MQYWPCFELDSGTFVGCCGLRPYRPAERMPEFGLQLRSACWGRGYGAEAGYAVLRYGFEALGALRISAGHHPGNVASGRLLLKLGFRPAGTEYYPPTGLEHPAYRLEEGWMPEAAPAGSERPVREGGCPE